MVRAPWRADPACMKCRRKAPTMRWGRWLAFAEGILPSLRAEDECQLLTCARCGHQWLMDLAPAEAPRA